MVELLFVLLIAGILMAVAFPRFNDYMQHRQLVNARSAVMTMAARARSLAVARGDAVKLRLSPTDEKVTVVNFMETDTYETLDLAAGDIRADLVAPGDVTICYVAGGFADPGCSAGLPTEITVGVRNASGTLDFNVNLAGQIQW